MVIQVLESDGEPVSRSRIVIVQQNPALPEMAFESDDEGKITVAITGDRFRAEILGPGGGHLASSDFYDTPPHHGNVQLTIRLPP